MTSGKTKVAVAGARAAPNRFDALAESDVVGKRVPKTLRQTRVASSMSSVSCARRQYSACTRTRSTKSRHWATVILLRTLRTLVESRNSWFPGRSARQRQSASGTLTSCKYCAKHQHVKVPDASRGLVPRSVRETKSSGYCSGRPKDVAVRQRRIAGSPMNGFIPLAASAPCAAWMLANVCAMHSP